MNKNKAKCDFLKSIRKKIADKLNVDLHQVECTFQGTCTGTCPKCKQEEDILNKELLKRGTAVGIGTVASLSLVACGPIGTNDIQGGIDYREPEIEESISGNTEEPENCEIDDSRVEGELQLYIDDENERTEDYDIDDGIIAGDIQYIGDEEENTENKDEAMNKIKLQYKDSKLKFETKELMGVIPSFSKY